MLEDKGNLCTGNAIVYSRLVQNHDISEGRGTMDRLSESDVHYICKDLLYCRPILGPSWMLWDMALAFGTSVNSSMLHVQDILSV